MTKKPVKPEKKVIKRTRVGKAVSTNLDSYLKQLEQKKFGDDLLAELSHARFQEAKKRLRNFVINTDMKSNPDEKARLMSYFAHRSHTFTNLMRECFKARRGGMGGSSHRNQGSFQQQLQNSEAEMKKVFKIVNTKKADAENLSQEYVNERAHDAIQRFRRDNPHVDPNKKIFMVLGQYPDVR